MRSSHFAAASKVIVRVKQKVTARDKRKALQAKFKRAPTTIPSCTRAIKTIHNNNNRPANNYSAN